MSVVMNMAGAMLSVALLLSIYRLLRGPSLPDRVIALDLIATLVVGIIAVYAIATGQAVFLRDAIVLAVISFLGTIAFAFYVGKGGTP
jgi:multicomponent Na+:H+ antiporter subunit F